jgi:hypothetical protein
VDLNADDGFGWGLEGQYQEQDEHVSAL